MTSWFENSVRAGGAGAGAGCVGFASAFICDSPRPCPCPVPKRHLGAESRLADCPRGGWTTWQPLWDQLTLREGKVERQGWMTFYDTAKPRGERRFFILRGVNLTCFESEVMEDSGVRVACLRNAKVSYADVRAICLAGQWYSIRQGFVWESDGKSLSFECEDEADARAWVALATAAGRATLSEAPAGAAAANGQAPQTQVDEGHKQARARPAPPAYPHESEYGGGKDYVSAPYNGGKSILEPEVGWRRTTRDSLPPSSRSSPPLCALLRQALPRRHRAPCS